MNPDPTFAAQFHAKGYCVFPLANHTKKTGVSGWTTVPRDEVAHKFTTQSNPTGWGLQPRKDDPYKLVILDVDDYQTPLEEILKVLFIMGEPPEGTGIVRSCSGGWHFYFRHPEEFKSKEPPASFTLPRGVKGDIRASVRGNALLVLPGSVAPSKQTNELAPYEVVSGPMNDPYELAEMPADLWLRLRGATKTLAADNPNLHPPTEIRKLREILMAHIPDDSIARGCWSNRAAELGQIWGRIWANADSCPDFEQDALFGLLTTKCATDTEGNLDRTTFDTNFRSGWNSGRANAKKYGPENKFPGETEVVQECKAVFDGQMPWLQENKDLSGKRECYILGIGNQRVKVTSIDNRQEVLGLIAKLAPETNMDDLTRSPLFLKVGWYNVLKTRLYRTAKVNTINAEPEVELRDKLRTAIRDTADASRFGSKLREAQPILDHQPDAYATWFLYNQGQFTLIAPPQAVKQMLLGLPPECQSFLDDFGTKKRDSHGQLWRFPLSNINDSAVLSVVEARYQEYLEKKFEV